MKLETMENSTKQHLLMLEPPFPPDWPCSADQERPMEFQQDQL